MSGWQAGRFEKLISAKLYVRFTLGLHRMVGLFNKSCLHLHLAHLGVTLAGSACRVKGVKIGLWALTQE